MKKVGNHCSDRCITSPSMKYILIHKKILEEKSNKLIVEIVFESKKVNI